MSALIPKIDVCFENSPKVLMARVTGTSATLVTQGVLDAVTYLVKSYADRTNAENDVDGTTVIAETALTISSVIFNTVQTDNDWPSSEPGYNHKFTVPASAFPVSDRWYRVESWCSPTAGDDFPGAIFLLYCKATGRS